MDSAVTGPAVDPHIQSGDTPPAAAPPKACPTDFSSLSGTTPLPGEREPAPNPRVEQHRPSRHEANEPAATAGPVAYVASIVPVSYLSREQVPPRPCNPRI